MASIDLQKEEYDSLRSEILGYIRQYFDVMVAVIAAAALLLAAGFQTENSNMFLCIYVPLFFVPSHWKTIGTATLRLSSYLRVFYGDNDSTGWESRNARRRAKEWSQINTEMKNIRISNIIRTRFSNRAYQPLYWGLAFTASFLSCYYSKSWARLLPWLIFAGWGIWNWYCSVHIINIYKDGCASEIEMWRKMRDSEVG